MPFDTLEAWLDWQASSHPVEIELGLGRVREVAARLDVLQPAERVITVAGTNGKGSSVALLEGVLQRSGYRTGCYTSPHLLHYRERIRWDGQLAADSEIVAAFNAIDAVRGDVSLSYFEWSTLAALWLFKRADLDVCLLEVGMGGRLDAVNIVDADVALVTSIGIDHAEWLGHSREAISLEKIGIARQGRPLVCADTDIPAVFIERSAEIGARLQLRNRDFDLRLHSDHWSWEGPSSLLEDLPMPALQGRHQLDNAAGVLMALEALGLPHIDESVIRSSLQEVTLNGRFERISGKFEIILDVAHNADGSRSLAAVLADQAARGETWCLLGVLADKDARTMLANLKESVDHWVLVSPDSPRALDVDALEALYLEMMGAADYRTARSVEEGFELVNQVLTPTDRLVVTGSFYTVGQVKAVLNA